jgi:hypothetical protein
MEMNDLEPRLRRLARMIAAFVPACAPRAEATAPMVRSAPTSFLG